MAKDADMKMQYQSGSGTNRLVFRGRIPADGVAGGYIAIADATAAMATDGSSAMVDGNGTTVPSADADHAGGSAAAGADASRLTQMLTAVATYGGANPTLPFFPTTTGPYAARDTGCGIFSFLNAAPIPDFADPSLDQVCIISGPWDGENAVLKNGPNPSPGTTFVWQTLNKTDAYAVYFQTEYQINDTWAITLGGSYSEDEKVAEENLVQYNLSLIHI